MDLLSTYLFFASLLLFSAFADQQTYIIRVRNDMKPSRFSTVEQWYSSTLKTLKSRDQKELGDLLYVYKTVFQGFSAILTLQQAESIKTRPEILAVYPDRILQLHTTRSPQFLGLTTKKSLNRILEDSDYGSNVIIGLLDSGIWPERESFHDRGLGPVPSHWKGECAVAENFTKSLCNKKLIGARFFHDGFSAKALKDFNSPRDSEGHGTHTASTAAGREVRKASFLGYAAGTAAGIAPKARIAVYKICWPGGCSESDIIAGFDKAVEDGVDVISLSVGSSAMEYNSDPIAIAAFGAIDHGVIVSASAGNSGAGEFTVTNIAPWIVTVGAGTIDRSFPADLLLENGQVFTGSSLYSGKPLRKNKLFPLVYAGNVSAIGVAFCLPDSLDKKLVAGKIVLCERGGGTRAEKGEAVKQAGGVAMVLANDENEGESLRSDAHVLPALSITNKASDAVKGYIATSPTPRATIVFRGTQVNVKPAPVVAGFSSRGPNWISPYITKPDLLAPGVDILAAWPDGLSPTGLNTDKRKTAFNILSGTSMSCPHVSGLAALLKGVHKDWSPARIKSAMMTAAYVRDNAGNPILDGFNNNVSNVWGYGSGHVDPERAVDPGLVFDLTADDYVEFLCASNYSKKDIEAIARRKVSCGKKGLKKPWNLNYPSISVVFDRSSGSKYEVAVTRTVTHVSKDASRYTVKIENPSGVLVSVDPLELGFSQTEEKRRFVVNISAAKAGLPLGERTSVFGRMTWSDGKHLVGLPIVVTWQN